MANPLELSSDLSAGETSAGVTVTGAAVTVGHRVEVSAPYTFRASPAPDM